MPARPSSGDDAILRLPLRVLCLADVTARPLEVRILEEQPMRPVRSSAELAERFPEAPTDLWTLAGALPHDGTALLDVLDSGPYDQLVEVAEVPTVEKMGLARMAAHARGFRNGGPLGVIVIRHRQSLSPIERLVWARLAELAAFAQVLILADAEHAHRSDAPALEALSTSRFGHALFRCEGRYATERSEAVELATHLVEAWARAGARLSSVPEVRDGPLGRARSVDGTPLLEALFAQWVTRAVIAAAGEARRAGAALDGVERRLLDGRDPPCTHARLSVEGSRSVPGARFTLRFATSPRWTGDAWTLERRGRFDF